MKISKILLLILFLIIFPTSAFSQDFTKTNAVSSKTGKQDTNRKHFIGSSFFLLGNLDREDSPEFFQLDYGYQFSRKEAIIFEAITWTYYEPLGTYGSSGESYPGKIRAYGIGVGYQRFIWKSLYSTIQATPFFQQFYDSNNKKIQDGFQLYLQLRLGYRFEFFNQRWFIEPAVAFNYWPVNTNFPTSFKEIEKGSPNYSLFEPSLNFGFKF